MSGSAEPAEHADRSISRRWFIVGAAVLLAVAVAGVGLAIAATRQVDHLRSQVGTMREDIGQLKAQRVKDNHDIATGFQTAATDLTSRIGSAQSAADYASQQAKDAADLADQIRGCVNTYMDTIALARGGQYRYNYC